MVDKNQAIIDYLLQCPSIQNSQLYFNFINAEDSNHQIITLVNDKSIDRPYIDGSVLKRYTFTVVAFKSITYIPVPKDTELSNENVEDMFDVQQIIDWVTAQSDAKNFPNFGDDCFIEDVKTTTDNPNLNGVDTSLTPSLAKYSISIQVDYLDKSKVTWNK